MAGQYSSVTYSLINLINTVLIIIDYEYKYVNHNQIKNQLLIRILID